MPLAQLLGECLGAHLLLLPPGQVQPLVVGVRAHLRIPRLVDGVVGNEPVFAHELLCFLVVHVFLVVVDLGFDIEEAVPALLFPAALPAVLVLVLFVFLVLVILLVILLLVLVILPFIRALFLRVGLLLARISLLAVSGRLAVGSRIRSARIGVLLLLHRGGRRLVGRAILTLDLGVRRRAPRSLLLRRCHWRRRRHRVVLVPVAFHQVAFTTTSGVDHAAGGGRDDD